MQTKKPYKLVPSNKYSRRWTAAKKKFKEDTGKKYPATHKTFKALGLKLFSVREGQGIESALKKIESLLPKSHVSAEGLKAFRDALPLYNQAYPKYIRYLADVVKTPPAGVNRADFTAGIKFLEDELDEINADLKIEVTKAKLAVGEIKKEDYDAPANSLMKNVRQKVGLAMVWIDERREDPDAADFRKDIVKITRDITQEIGNIDKLTKIGYEFDHGQPNELFEALSAWSHRGRTVENDATAEEVLEELEALQEIVEDIATWAR